MIRLTYSVVILALVATVYSTDYFVEKFEGKFYSLFCSFVFHFLFFYKDESYKNRWVQSTAKSDLGEFKLSHGKFYGDAKKDLGKYID
jgi:hypothetical protein